MKTSNQIVCVLRSINGVHQWVAASGRHDLVNNEATTVGFFNSFEEQTGPSGSHVVTCYEPLRNTAMSKLDINEFNASTRSTKVGSFKTCVVRLIGTHDEFVAAKGRTDLVEGEALVSGNAVSSSVKSGPNGSHVVTVWNFVGAMQRDVVPQGGVVGPFASGEFSHGGLSGLHVIDAAAFADGGMSHLGAHPASYVGAPATR